MLIEGRMQHKPGGHQVSLRGASSKEQTRDELLDRVAQERGIRSLAKQAAASALFIQRVWRGRTVARQVANQARWEWDKWFLMRQDGNQSPVSADTISNQVLRPLFMILRHSSCFRLNQTQEGSEDAGRLATCFRLLLQSIHNPDPRFNYCDLALGFPDKMAKWVYQARYILRLTCAAIEKEGCGWQEAQQAVRNRNPATLEGANLPGLAMRVMVALTDTSTWKSFNEPGQEVRKEKADLVALNLLEWLANGNGGLFLAVRSYIIANFPVPGIKDDQVRPQGKKDKFIITASIITITLRPLLMLAAACTEDQEQNSEVSKERKDFRPASARAAAQFSAHILTIPFLPQRLPGPLLPALEHPSALAPCLRAFGVPIKNLLRLATSTSSFSSIALQQGKVDSQLAAVPLSAWALANLVYLASSSGKSISEVKEFSGQFVTGLVYQDYVQGLCCLLEDLKPWIEANRQRRRAQKLANEDDEEKGLDDTKSVGVGNESIIARETTTFQLLTESLRPLHHQWHLLQLMNEAAQNDSASISFLAVRRSASGVSESHFGLADIAKLYANLLPVFAVLNPFGGALPVLNLLAFTPMLLPQLWDWLHISPGLAHLINPRVLGDIGDVPEAKSRPSKAVKESIAPMSAGKRLAAALGWRSRSSSGPRSLAARGGGDTPITPSRQEIVPRRMSIDVERVVPARLSIDRLGGSTMTPDRHGLTPSRMSLHRPVAGPPQIDRLLGADAILALDRQSRVEVSGSSDSQGVGETSRPSERQGSGGLGRRPADRRFDGSRSVDIGEASVSSGRQEFVAARRSLDGFRSAASRRLPNRPRGSDPRPLDILESIRDLEAEEAKPPASDMHSIKKGPEGVPNDVLPVLLLFCAAYSHLLVVLDDEEFYEKEEPFTLEQQRVISTMLNTMVYYGCLSPFKRRHSLLMDVAIRCLRSLYERDCRRKFCSPDLWLAPAVATRPPIAAAARAHEVAIALERTGDSSQAPPLGAILTTIPHVLPFDERVQIFREFVRGDKLLRRMGGEPVGPGPGTIEISVRRDHIVEDGFARLNALGSKLKCCVNVSFVNELGLAEAGLDYGGLFKEFLTDLAKAAFDPGYGLFVQTATEEGLLFPNAAASSLGHGLKMLEFLGRIVGKALYEGILLEYSFSPLFVSKLLGRYSFLDELSSLDAELHRNLVYLKHYKGDARDLALDFTVTEELFGKHKIVELRPGGADIPVTNENKLQYVHAMADYKLNRQMRPLVNAFLRGMSDLIPSAWLSLFNAKEFNKLLSGGDHDFDVEDLCAHTRYTGGYTDTSRTVKMFWEVVLSFEPEERCSLLKFVTSCSRPPLLGFKHLLPAFTIHKVACDASMWAVIGGQDVDRLPSASTCYNTLKLPTYKRIATLREKLRYSIKSNAGFELS